MCADLQNRNVPALRRRNAIRKIGRVSRRLLAPIERRFGVVTHVDTAEPVVALTFDDGPHRQWTPRLLDLLDRHQAKATFFMVGEMAIRHPDLVDRVISAGHSIGNHSWNHPSFPAVSFSQRTTQITRCEQALRAGSEKLFRPPFGDLDWISLAQLLMKGYRVIGWNVSSADWERRDDTSIVDLVNRQLKPGSIVLMHDHLFAYSTSDEWSREPMLLALDQLLSRAPFRFVTVPELLTLGRARGRYWRKHSDGHWLRSLQSFSDLGFKY